MTKLEFINSLIKTYEHSVQKIEQRLQKCGQLGDDEGFKDAIEDLQDNKDILNTYKEIKTDLEAWEVVKEELQIVFKGKNHYKEPLHRYELNVIGQNKINTLNKALEGKEC